MPIRDPRELDAIVIGHMHADHYIDLVSLRYLMPWAGVAGRRMPGPAAARRARPGSTTWRRRSANARRSSTTPSSVLEYDPASRIHVGDLTIELRRRPALRPGLGLRRSATRTAADRDLRRHRPERRVRRGGPRRRRVRRRGDAALDGRRTTPARPPDGRGGDRDGATGPAPAAIVLVHYRAELRDPIDAPAPPGRAPSPAGRGSSIEVAEPSPVTNGRSASGRRRRVERRRGQSASTCRPGVPRAAARPRADR